MMVTYTVFAIIVCCCRQFMCPSKALYPEIRSQCSHLTPNDCRDEKRHFCQIDDHNALMITDTCSQLFAVRQLLLNGIVHNGIVQCDNVAQLSQNDLVNSHARSIVSALPGYSCSTINDQTKFKQDAHSVDVYQLKEQSVKEEQFMFWDRYDTEERFVYVLDELTDDIDINSTVVSMVTKWSNGHSITAHVARTLGMYLCLIWPKVFRPVYVYISVVLFGTMKQAFHMAGIQLVVITLQFMIIWMSLICSVLTCFLTSEVLCSLVVTCVNVVLIVKLIVTSWSFWDFGLAVSCSCSAKCIDVVRSTEELLDKILLWVFQIGRWIPFSFSIFHMVGHWLYRLSTRMKFLLVWLNGKSSLNTSSSERGYFGRFLYDSYENATFWVWYVRTTAQRICLITHIMKHDTNIPIASLISSSIEGLLRTLQLDSFRNCRLPANDLLCTVVNEEIVKPSIRNGRESVNDRIITYRYTPDMDQQDNLDRLDQIIHIHGDWRQEFQYFSAQGSFYLKKREYQKASSFYCIAITIVGNEHLDNYLTEPEIVNLYGAFLYASIDGCNTGNLTCLDYSENKLELLFERCDFIVKWFETRCIKCFLVRIIRCYLLVALTRFCDAKSSLFELEHSTDYCCVVKYPGKNPSSIVSTTNIKTKLKELINFCGDKSPDAKCCATTCSKFGHKDNNIFIDHPSNNGYVVVKCVRSCSFEYHRNCWNLIMQRRGMSTEKEIDSMRCSSSGCDGVFSEVWVYSTLALKPEKISLNKSKWLQRKDNSVKTNGQPFYETTKKKHRKQPTPKATSKSTLETSTVAESSLLLDTVNHFKVLNDDGGSCRRVNSRSKSQRLKKRRKQSNPQNHDENDEFKTVNKLSTEMTRNTNDFILPRKKKLKKETEVVAQNVEVEPVIPRDTEPCSESLKKEPGVVLHSVEVEPVIPRDTEPCPESLKKEPEVVLHNVEVEPVIPRDTEPCSESLKKEPEVVLHNVEVEPVIPRDTEPCSESLKKEPEVVLHNVEVEPVIPRDTEPCPESLKKEPEVVLHNVEVEPVIPRDTEPCSESLKKEPEVVLHNVEVEPVIPRDTEPCSESLKKEPEVVLHNVEVEPVIPKDTEHCSESLKKEPEMVLHNVEVEPVIPRDTKPCNESLKKNIVVVTDSDWSHYFEMTPDLKEHKDQFIKSLESKIDSSPNGNLDIDVDELGITDDDSYLRMMTLHDFCWERLLENTSLQFTLPRNIIKRMEVHACDIEIENQPKLTHVQCQFTRPFIDTESSDYTVTTTNSPRSSQTSSSYYQNDESIIEMNMEEDESDDSVLQHRTILFDNKYDYFTLLEDRVTNGEEH